MVIKVGKHIHASVEIEADPMLTESIKEECEEEETMEVEVDPWWIHSSSPRGKKRQCTYLLLEQNIK